MALTPCPSQPAAARRAQINPPALASLAAAVSPSRSFRLSAAPPGAR